MKLFVALLAVSICLFGLVNALPNDRRKRAVQQEQCPQDVSCNDYANDKLKLMNACAAYNVDGFNIEWQSCGLIACVGDSKLGKEDLSKPYPDCCAQCE